MALIMEKDVNFYKGYIRIDKIKVAKVTEDTLEFINYETRKNGHVPDQANILKVKYFKEWLMKSQTKTAKEICSKYL